MIVLHEIGMAEKVDCVRTVVAMAAEPNADLLPDNPLGKIPTLVLDDGSSLFDSKVICEYLDTLHDGPKLFPEAKNRKFRHLRWLSFADGLTDVLLLWRNERLRPDGTQYPIMLESFEIKTRRGLAAWEMEVDQLASDDFAIGHAALACTLGQLDFRFGDSNWRSAHPKLADWYDEIRKRPSVAATEIVDDGMAAPDVPWATGPAFAYE